MSTAAGTTPVCRVLRIVADDGLGHGELTEVPVTEIGSGELLLRASHSSVNRTDRGPAYLPVLCDGLQARA